MNNLERIMHGYPIYAEERIRLKKEVYSISELVDMGYPKKLLKQLIHTDEFSRIGFRLAESRNSKTFFYKEKLDRFLEHREDERQGVRTW